MRKCSKRETRFPRAIPPASGDEPRQDDPHDAVNFELMSIALSVARLQEIIGPRPDLAAARVVIRPAGRTAAKRSRHRAA